jgi:hypothetical protein
MQIIMQLDEKFVIYLKKENVCQSNFLLECFFFGSFLVFVSFSCSDLEGSWNKKNEKNNKSFKSFYRDSNSGHLKF